MIFPNFVTGVIATLSVRAVNAGPCRPSSQSTAVAASDTTTAETSFAISTLLTTSGLDATTDSTSFIALTAETTTSELASTSTTFFPADLFPCRTDPDCDAFVELCDTYRCGCINRRCERLTDTTTAKTTTEPEVPTTTEAETTAAETTTTAEPTTTTVAVEVPTTTKPETTTAETTTTAEPTTTTEAGSEPEPQPQFGCGDPGYTNTYTYNGVTLNLFCERSYSYDGLENAVAESFGECLRLCTLNTSCNGVVWRRASRICSLTAMTTVLGADNRFDLAQVSVRN